MLLEVERNGRGIWGKRREGDKGMKGIMRRKEVMDEDMEEIVPSSISMGLFPLVALQSGTLIIIVPFTTLQYTQKQCDNSA
jgi:hypothetical protein